MHCIGTLSRTPREIIFPTLEYGPGLGENAAFMYCVYVIRNLDVIKPLELHHSLHKHQQIITSPPATSQDGGCSWFWTQCPCTVVAVDPLRGCCTRLVPEYHTNKTQALLSILPSRPKSSETSNDTCMNFHISSKDAGSLLHLPLVFFFVSICSVLTRSDLPVDTRPVAQVVMEDVKKLDFVRNWIDTQSACLSQSSVCSI